MKSALCLALLVACLILVAFSERMGLPGPVASELVRGLIALCCLALALLSATSRLMHFFDGDRPSLLFGRLALQACLLMGALPLFPVLSLNEPAAALALATGYLLAMVLLPPRYRTTLGPEADRPFENGPDRSWFLGLATGVAALGLLLMSIEPLTRELARVAGFELRALAQPVLGFLVLLLILGGANALSRLARAAIVLSILFVVLPLGAEMAVERASTGVDQWREMVANAKELALPWVKEALSLKFLEAFVTGVALGLVGLALLSGEVGPVRRGGFALVAIGLASVFAVFFAAEMMRLDALVRDVLQKTSPTAWPLFTFDEAVRGWLKACGTAPSDAVDVLQACRRLGLGGMVPPEQMQVETAMAGPVLAVSRGWPAIFGLIWNLLPLLAALIFVAMLLQAASLSFSETVLFRALRPRLLRAGRLASARLVMIAIAGAIAYNPRPAEPKFVFWLLTGAALLAGTVWMADRLLALRRRLAGWVKRPAPAAIPPIPANDDAPAFSGHPASP
jgi:hypothetical protein